MKPFSNAKPSLSTRTRARSPSARPGAAAGWSDDPAGYSHKVYGTASGVNGNLWIWANLIHQLNVGFHGFSRQAPGMKSWYLFTTKPSLTIHARQTKTNTPIYDGFAAQHMSTPLATCPAFAIETRRCKKARIDVEGLTRQKGRFLSGTKTETCKQLMGQKSGHHQWGLVVELPFFQRPGFLHHPKVSGCLGFVPKKKNSTVHMEYSYILSILSYHVISIVV